MARLSSHCATASSWLAARRPRVWPSQASMLRWCKTNLSEAFIAWTHLKALRVHAESILTYGLPVNYRAMLVKVRSVRAGCGRTLGG